MHKCQFLAGAFLIFLALSLNGNSFFRIDGTDNNITAINITITTTTIIIIASEFIDICCEQDGTLNGFVIAVIWLTEIPHGDLTSINVFVNVVQFSSDLRNDSRLPENPFPTSAVITEFEIVKHPVTETFDELFSEKKILDDIIEIFDNIETFDSIDACTFCNSSAT